jgi:peroxiredoxin
MAHAPEFTLTTPDGPVSLDHYRGRPLILAFFPLAFTGG